MYWIILCYVDFFQKIILFDLFEMGWLLVYMEDFVQVFIVVGDECLKVDIYIFVQLILFYCGIVEELWLRLR